MIARIVRVVVRVRPVPLLVRVATGVAGYSALLLAVPGSVRALPLALVAMAALAVLPAVSPGGSGALLVTLAGAGGFLLGTDPQGWGGAAHTGRVVALASLLYLVHVLAALAAAVPYDAVVAADALARWLLRAAVVLLVSAGLTLLVLVGLPRLVTAAGLAPAGYVAATVAGIALAVAATLLLRRLLAAPSRS